MIGEANQRRGKNDAFFGMIGEAGGKFAGLIDYRIAVSNRRAWEFVSRKATWITSRHTAVAMGAFGFGGMGKGAQTDPAGRRMPKDGMDKPAYLVAVSG